jgi:hypothetical protein
MAKHPFFGIGRFRFPVITKKPYPASWAGYGSFILKMNVNDLIKSRLGGRHNNEIPAISEKESLQGGQF